MSLINDALKRAHQAQASAPTPAPDNSAAPLHPAESPARRSVWMWFWYTSALMLAAVLASWAILIGFLASRDLNASAKSTNTGKANTEVTVTAREPEPAAVAPAAAPFPMSTVVPLENTVAPSYSVDGPEATATSPGSALGSVPAQAPPELPAAAPVAPALKLQGIFYRRTNPTAMINSKMVGRGDRVLNAKVL